MKFPILLKTEEAAKPPGQLYYEVAENGVFQVRDTPLYRAVTRVHEAIPGLLPGAEELVIKFPRLPRAGVGDVLAFFDEAYRRWGGEAVVILFYCPTRREYRIAAPPQTIPGRWRYDGRWLADYSVRYESLPRPEGFVSFGTIHSHADLAAYSSGLDCDDERYGDGLHIVFGDFHRRRVSVAATFVAGGVRFRIAPDDVLDDWWVPARPAHPDWMAQVHREDRSAGGRSGDTSGSTAATVAAPAKSYAEPHASGAPARSDGSNGDGSDGSGHATVAPATPSNDARASMTTTTALGPLSASPPTWQESVERIVCGSSELKERDVGSVPGNGSEETIETVETENTGAFGGEVAAGPPADSTPGCNGRGER